MFSSLPSHIKWSQSDWQSRGEDRRGCGRIAVEIELGMGRHVTLAPHRAAHDDDASGAGEQLRPLAMNRGQVG